jgi:cytochrome P450
VNIGEFATRLTVHVACQLLGVPESGAQFLAQRVNAFFARESGTRGQTRAGKSATADLFEYLGAWIEERRRSPVQRDDILGRLMAFEFEGWRFDDDDLISMLQLVVTGSTETLPKAFAGAVYQLARHSDQRAEVVADPGLTPRAFWEGLRMEMPTQMLGRRVVETWEIHGEKLEPGQGVLYLWASANRDDREFPEPDRFDIHRHPERILSFGHGLHRCLGAHFAKLEGRVLLEEMLARVPDYAVDEAHIHRERTEFIQGFRHLPIDFNL